MNEKTENILIEEENTIYEIDSACIKEHGRIYSDEIISK